MEEKFITPKYNIMRKHKNASSNDVNTIQPIYWAVTINISPNFRMNRKVWKKYSGDEQRRQLSRIETHFRKVNTWVKLHKIAFELCPTVHNMHYHALYESTPGFPFVLEEYFRKYDTTDANTIEPWRHICVKEVYNHQGWVDYLMKDQQIK